MKPQTQPQPQLQPQPKPQLNLGLAQLQPQLVRYFYYNNLFSITKSENGTAITRSDSAILFPVPVTMTILYKIL